MSHRFLHSRLAPAAAALVGLASVVVSVSVSVAAPAVAEPDDRFTAAVIAARGASSCPPLRYDPTLERAAAIVNRSTTSYFDQSSAVIPADTEPQPLPLLKDLGSPAGRATLLQGASQTSGMEVKGAVVQGFSIIPDCGYTDFGTSTIYSESTGYNLVVAVLAGP